MTSLPLLFAAMVGLAPLAVLAAADAAPVQPPSPGHTVFVTYCATCHGPEGAGLIGPNLTDTVFLHGGTREDIVKTISKGVDGKGMPAWESILNKEQISQVADHAFSLIGKNLPSGMVAAMGMTTVTPFPKGSAVQPLLLRTFMPTQGVGDEVLSHYHRGLAAAKYSPEKGTDIAGSVAPVVGVTSGIAVSFGDGLAYCFDATECRLLYTWSGGFLDMTKYWGAGAGGSRAGNDYVPVVMGTVAYVTHGAEPLEIPGSTDVTPHFTGYRKMRGVPLLEYRLGTVAFTQLIAPGAAPGVATCAITTSGAPKGLVYHFDPHISAQITCDKGRRDGVVLTLSAADAAAFTLTIVPVAR